MSKRDAEEYVVAFSKYWSEKSSPRKVDKIMEKASKIVPYKIDFVTKDVPSMQLALPAIEDAERSTYTVEGIKTYLSEIFPRPTQSLANITIPADEYYIFGSVLDILPAEVKKNAKYRKSFYPDEPWMDNLFEKNYAMVQGVEYFKSVYRSEMIKFYIENSVLNDFRKNLFVPNEDQEYFEIDEVESTLSGMLEHERFIDFVWGSKPGPQPNHYNILLTLFKKFAYNNLSKAINSKISLKNYIIEKYNRSHLKEDLDSLKNKLNLFFYNQSLDKKVYLVFTAWEEYPVSLEEGSEILYESYFINYLFEGVDVQSKRFFAITKYDEIVYFEEGFNRLFFCYQVRTKDLINGARTNSYLNFLINGTKIIEGEQYKATFPLIRNGLTSDPTVPPEEMYNYDLPERFAKVNLIKEEDIIYIGDPDYWTARQDQYSNKDEIFKNGIGCGEDNILSSEDLAKNTKICAKGINLNKNFPSFSLFENMSKQDIINTLIYEEYSLTPDLIAIDDIVALFEFDQSEFEEIKPEVFERTKFSDGELRLTIRKEE